MADLIFLMAAVGFFALSFGYALACEKLRGGADD